ncbi:LysR family transcriptional regulator [Streptomyces yunnanensis]|uniref:LysR family transcriptional regulator n=1 Tax=Streptomyces yunnanensis TaxID=156453 RepID=A0ABY8A484_9ACTN|nr:LysR family transcriptional regulator [Streptomyces yunnanensis]WEB39755.1 LysR family transcriptional regulator [Streptomyces yunnanensis]
MELQQVRCFVVVAEEGQLGRATLRLGLVRSAVEQRIRRLEHELRTELFDPGTPQPRLTAAGERFLPEARALLAAEERARAVVAPRPAAVVPRAVAAAPAGTLRLGVSRGLAAHLERVLPALARIAPRFTVEPVLVAAPERPDLVVSGALDAAFVRGPAPGPALGGLRLVPLWQDPLVAAVPAPHPLAASPGALGLAELAGVPLALTDRCHNPPLVDLVVNACHAVGFAPAPGPRYGSLDAALAAIGACTAAAGMWTAVHAAHARRLPVPGVAYLPFRNPGMELTTSLAVRRVGPPAGVDLLLRACAAAGAGGAPAVCRRPVRPAARTGLRLPPNRGW